MGPTPSKQGVSKGKVTSGSRRGKGLVKDSSIVERKV
jgi:hypothetical protein